MQSSNTLTEGASRLVRIATLLLLSFFLTGCIHNKGFRASKAREKEIEVVAVRGQPIVVMSENLALVAVGTALGGVGGGVAANAADQGATATKRATLTERLNAEAVDFRPEVILAEECVKLLKSSSKVQFQSLTLHLEVLDLPGRSELIGDETQPFKPNTSNSFAWHLRARDWMNTPPTAEYSRAVAAQPSSLTVEVVFPVVRLINAKVFEMDVAIRIVDCAQGRVVGSRYTMIRKKITPITADSDFQVFAADFRRCASEAARQCLKDLNLL